jgi:predicted nucleic acid-binding protein
MIVVSDTTPLHYLLLIRQEELLFRMFGRVIVPSAVYRELQRARTPYLVRMWVANPPGWFEVRGVAREPGPPPGGLGQGEWEAIALAQELKAELLLIDDREGRREARRRLLPVTGTLGILEKGAERGLIDLPAVLAKLQQTNFYLPAETVESLLIQHSGGKKTGG